MSSISIVIPMYNEARHITRTLIAALHAADAAGLECELIVVDNGSDDQGPQIARQFGAQVLHMPGLLIGALRNRGASVAKGEWLAFIDADIEMPEDWLTRLIKLEASGQADVLGLDLHTRPRRRGSPMPGSAEPCVRPPITCTRRSGYPPPTC